MAAPMNRAPVNWFQRLAVCMPLTKSNRKSRQTCPWLLAFNAGPTCQRGCDLWTVRYREEIGKRAKTLAGETPDSFRCRDL
jgi:hypothetical protein